MIHPHLKPLIPQRKDLRIKRQAIPLKPPFHSGLFRFDKYGAGQFYMITFPVQLQYAIGQLALCRDEAGNTDIEEDCFELLLKEYKNNNEKNKEQIKKILIKYFETLGADDERTKNYRRKFSSIMFA